jgi:hypothetical protein
VKKNGVEREMIKGMSRKERLQQARHYALYYGKGRVDELVRFDVVVIEESGMSIADIRRLKKGGALVFAYLSVTELHPNHPLFTHVTEQDLLLVKGIPVKNEQYDTFVLDLQSDHWLQILNEKADILLNQLGVDGLFLDTLDQVESSLLPVSIREAQFNAAINFIFRMKQRYPDRLLIQNNGLEQLCLHTAPWIDGLCWENPPLTLNTYEAWNREVLKRLDHMQKEWALSIFLLLEETVENERGCYPKAKSLAEQRGYLCYLAPTQYVAGIL